MLGQPRDAWNWKYQVYRVDDDGNVQETLALADNFMIALAAFEASRQARSWAKLELRNCGRVMRAAKTGGYDPHARCIDQHDHSTAHETD